MGRRRFSPLVGLVVLMALLAMAVLPVAAQDATPAGSAANQPSEPLVPPPAGKTELVVAQSADVTALDPQLSTTSNDITVSFNLYDNLVFRDRNSQLQPMLATEWTLVNDTTWAFKLRQGVKFHNGEDFKADDVEFTIERTYDPAAKTSVATVFGSVQDVQVVDDYTVHFLMKAPDPLLPARLAFYGGQMLPRDYFNEVGAERFNTAPVGTGPVTFVEWVPDDHLTLARNETYWGEPIAVQRVTFRPIPETAARIAALQTGEVDIITKVPPDQVQQVRDLENARAEQVQYNGLYVLAVNSKVKPLDNPLVKQALALAIDRQLIVDELWSGQGTVPTGPVVQGDFAYDPNAQPFVYDPDQAKALLDQAGYNGEEVVIETTDGYVANDRPMAEAIAAMWEAVGVKVRLDVIEVAVRAEKNSNKTFLGVWWSDPTSALNDPDGMMWRLLAPGGAQDYWRNEEFDRLGMEARTSLDPALREQNYRRMFEIFRENLPWIPVLQPLETYGVSNSVDWYPFANQYFNLRADNLRLAQ